MLAAALVLAAGPLASAPAPAAAPLRLPLRFEENLGQLDARVRFTAAAGGMRLLVGDEETVVLLPGGAAARLALAGASCPRSVRGEGRLPGRSAWLVGDRARWRSGVAAYERVVLEEVYPGVDLVHHGGRQALEHDFVLAPGVGAEAIELVLEGPGGERPEPAADGGLAAGPLRLLAPLAWQPAPDGRRAAVDAAFELRAEGRVGFRVAGRLDPRLPLVIDPVLAYSTYLGGALLDGALDVAVDAQGSAYLAGFTTSADFPATAGAWQAANAGGSSDAWVAKLTPAGDALVFSTYLGGTAADNLYGIAVDAAGDVYVTGATRSADFPVVDATQPAPGGGEDAFLARLAADGSSLRFATYIGGSADEAGEDVAVDGSGRAFVTGGTYSFDFPTRAALQPAKALARDAFLTAIDTAAPAAVAYSTYLGGNDDDLGHGVAADAGGAATVAGATHSTDFPTAAPLQGSSRGFNEAFVARLSAAGTLAWSTYLGGTDADAAHEVALDALGDVYLTGVTYSLDFPLAAPAQPALAGLGDAFVVRLAASGRALVYSTYLGGGDQDVGSGVAAAAAGSAFVTGATSSADFPLLDPVQPALGGGARDAFVARLTPAGAVAWSTFLGGTRDEGTMAVAADRDEGAYAAGSTYSTDYPTAAPLQPLPAGQLDAYVAKLGGCAAAVPAVARLLGVRAPARDDATFVWDPLPEARGGYNLWSVADRRRIDAARAPGGPGVRPVCTPAPTPVCADPGVVPGPGGTVFYYQVRGVCGGSEGE